MHIDTKSLLSLLIPGQVKSKLVIHKSGLIEVECVMLYKAGDSPQKCTEADKDTPRNKACSEPPWYDAYASNKLPWMYNRQLQRPRQGGIRSFCKSVLC